MSKILHLVIALALAASAALSTGCNAMGSWDTTRGQLKDDILLYIAALMSYNAGPSVTLSGGAAIAENGGTATITASLSAVSTLPVTVTLSYTGTATDTADYTTSSASILIPAGSLTGTVTITSTDDALSEGDETVIIDITSVANGTEIGTEQETVTITDDDAAPTVTLSGGAAIAENAGIATITATLSALSGQPVTVTLLYSGTASDLADYTTTGASIVIPAGSLTGAVTISGIDDAQDELDETVLVDIDTVTNGTESGFQQQTVTITDDDAAPTVTLSGGVIIAENAGTATITATLSAGSWQNVTVMLLYSGTATDPADYTTTGASILIPAGSMTGTVTITSTDDALNEGDETVIVDIDTVTNGTEIGTEQETVTITDDDGAPTVTLSGGAAIAENAGTATITATLSATSGLPVTVTLLYSGTATDPADYSTTGASILIPAGSLTGTVTITSTDDALNEGDETVIVDIDTVTNGTEVGTEQETVTITDDDAAPTVTLSGGAAIAENAGTATITATLSATSGLPVTVTLLYSGTATDPADYSTTGASILIPAGSLTGTVTITSTDDALNEGDETVIVDIDTVTNGTEVGTEQETVTITDDDAAPTVTLSGGAAIAENAGTATITATLSATSGLPVTVTLLYSGTATDPADYSTTGASILIPAGSLTGTVTITSTDDALNEGDETVIVDIDTVTNGTEIGTEQQTVTITDDDAAPTVTLSGGAAIAENAGTATITATLSATSALPVTVNLGYSGTATLTADYTRSDVAITIPAGSLTGTVTITGVDDALDETDETVIIDITSVINGTEIGTEQQTVTITDDDAAPTVTLSGGAAIAENAGTATITATLSATSGQKVTVTLLYSGTATDPADYTTTGASILIPAGSLTGTVTITSTDDALNEGDETVIVDIDTVTNGTEIGTEQETVTITDDDAAPTVTLSGGAAIAENVGTATITATLSATSALPVTVNLGYSGSATLTADYTRSDVAITIPAGSLTGTVTITGVDDALNEGDETL